MVKRDVIISALACGGKMSCRKQAAEFEDPPIVININSSTGISTGGGTIDGFKKAAAEYKKHGNGSILQGVLNTQKNLQPNRVALVSYLDGWSFINEVIKSDDFTHIDTIIVLEGLNTRSSSLLQQWEDFADKKKLVLVYSQITHKTVSSKSACSKIVTPFINEKELELPEYIKAPMWDKSISIYSKTEMFKTKIYHTDTLVNSWYSKSIMALEYSGKQSHDQTYIQQYVQPRIWQWLREQWKDPTTGCV
jgi:hypothetical protein